VVTLPLKIVFKYDEVHRVLKHAPCMRLCSFNYVSANVNHNSSYVNITFPQQKTSYNKYAPNQLQSKH